MAQKVSRLLRYLEQFLHQTPIRFKYSAQKRLTTRTVITTHPLEVINFDLVEARLVTPVHDLRTEAVASLCCLRSSLLISDANAAKEVTPLSLFSLNSLSVEDSIVSVLKSAVKAHVSRSLESRWAITASWSSSPTDWRLRCWHPPWTIILASVDWGSLRSVILATTTWDILRRLWLQVCRDVVIVNRDSRRRRRKVSAWRGWR